MKEDWKIIVTKFASDLEQEDKCFSIKDLCNNLLDGEWKFEDKNQVVEYLHDWIEASKARHVFHSKWSDLPNMKNVADYDQKEITKASELIELLS